MTCREKLKIERPEFLDSESWGGCIGCPSTYGYLEDAEWCPKTKAIDDKDTVCRLCWDREIPEKKESQDSKIDIQALIDDAMQKRDRSVAIYIHPENGISVHVYPWPDFEDLWKLYKDGKITTNEFRLKMNLPIMKNARNSVKRNPKIFGGERKIDQEESNTYE